MKPLESIENGNQDNARLEALRKREAAIKAALASEHMRLARKHQKESKRLESILGRVLLAAAAVSPGLQTMLKQTLETADLSDGERSFLKLKGWL